MIEKITILYEDDNIVAINKLHGLIVHPDGKHEEESVVDWIKTNYPEVVGVGKNMTLKDGTVIERPGIVHRIDRDTSGVLLIVKNNETYDYLRDKFKEREMTKVYRAFVIGKMRDKRGIIERAIMRSKTNFRKRTAFKGRGNVRTAITQYRALVEAPGVSYLELRPKTGRTHQLRVHLSSVGHPIIADALYGVGQEKKLGFERLALHAYSIGFIDQNGKEISVTAPLPPDFEKAEKMITDIAK